MEQILREVLSKAATLVDGLGASDSPAHVRRTPEG